MLQTIKLENILFLDIETVPEFEYYQQLLKDKKLLWEEKTQYQRKDEFTAEEFYERNGILAEFGKIICTSGDFFCFKNGASTFRLTTFKNEKRILLQEFAKLLQEHFSKLHHLRCAHNDKEFDSRL